MSKRSNTHFHLTYKRGSMAIVRQPETVIGGDAAMRLLEEIAAYFVRKGCRAVKYSVSLSADGLRIYDCTNEALSEQSFEVHECKQAECSLQPNDSGYGRWGKAERQKYLAVLRGRGLLG